MRKPSCQALARVRDVHKLKHTHGAQALAAAAHAEADRDAERRAGDERLDALCEFWTASLHAGFDPGVAAGAGLAVATHAADASTAAAAHADALGALSAQQEEFSRLTATEHALVGSLRRFRRSSEKRAQERSLLFLDLRGTAS